MKEGDGMQFQNNKIKVIPDSIKYVMSITDDYFADKAKRLSINIESKTIQYLLYNSFEVKIQTGERYGDFGAGIVIGSIILGPEILPGRQIKMDSSKASILDNLKLIDEYCRLRLPDKFLHYHGW